MTDLVLQTSDAEFENSGDMKLVLRGIAPTVQTSQGPQTVFPPAASLSFDSDFIQGSFTVAPNAGALTLFGTQVSVPGENSIAQPTIGSASLSGIAPSIAIDKPIAPGAGSLTFGGIQVYRGFGLYFTGQTPGVGIVHTKLVPTGSVAIVGKTPTPILESAGNIVKSPDSAEVAISGKAVSLNTTLPAGNPASLSVSGQTPITGYVEYPGKASLTLATLAPVVIGGSTPIPVIGAGANEGTRIRNTNATTDSGNRYNICDISGFKAKPGELVQRWDGYWVLPEFNEPRNMQDFVRVKPENQQGAKRPEPVGSETFVEDIYPSGVSKDDL